MKKTQHRNRNGKGRLREYEKSARTKAAILDAATREFATHGVGGARVDRIAKAANLNNHALYYHIGNKHALFRAVLERGYETFRVNQKPQDLKNMKPEAAMEKIIADVFEFVQGAPGHMTIASDVNRHRGAYLTADVRKRVRAAAAPLLSNLEIVLRLGKAQKRFAADIDAEHLYLTIFALCGFYFTNAYTVSVVAGRDLLEPKAIRNRKQQIQRFVMAALRPARP